MKKGSYSIMTAVAAIAYFAAFAAVTASEPLKVGVLTDITGIYSDLSGQGSIEAARMAAEDYGQKVLGRRIEIVAADHLNKPDVASELARAWYDRDGVNVIVDVPHSTSALAVQEVARSRGKLVIFSTGAASDLTGKQCSPTGVQWTYDTYSLTSASTKAVVKAGGDKWYFLAVDAAVGHAFLRDATGSIKAAGGNVVGSSLHPFAINDFSSFILRAQASGANVVGLANGGQDTIQSIQQAREFGLDPKKTRIVAMVLFHSDVRALGLEAAQGIYAVSPFYWDRDDASRAWSKRFFERRKAMPTMAQAGVYSALMHYFASIDAAGSAEALKVVDEMKRRPVNDMFARNGRVREDGLMEHPMFLLQVKAPSESKYPWDDMKVVAEIPGSQASRPVSEGGCPLLKQ